MQACLLLLAAALLPAQHELAATNPHTSPEDVQAGGRIFRSHCAECHGPKGGGGRGPDLRRGEYFHGSSDAALFRVILNGIPGTQMPGVYFEGPQVWQLVSFVRSLAREAVPVTVPGDAARGEKLYRSKGGCAKCHSVQGQGGSLGPDLTHIGSMRTPDHLRASLIDPEREVLPASWSVKAVDAKGTAYSGILLNQDAYSIQMLDTNENLRSLDRKGLKVEISHKRSLMPSYKDAMSGAELDDLVAYLYSLRRKK